MAAVGNSGTTMDSTASATTTTTASYGTYTQSLTALGLPTSTPVPGVRQAESESVMRRADDAKVFSPHPASLRSRPNALRAVTNRAEQHDAALLAAMEFDDQPTQPATEATRDVRTAASW